MLNREKEGLLTDMYEGLEYQVLEDLCNEWEFDNDVSVGKFVEQRIDCPFPSEEEACKMLDVRVFCAWMDKDCELGKYEEFIRSSSDKEDSEAILTRCKEELCGDLYCLRARRLSGEFLVIHNTGDIYSYTPGLFEEELDLDLVKRQIDSLGQEDLLVGCLFDLNRLVTVAAHRCYPELIQYVIQHQEDYEQFVKEKYC